MLSDAAAGLVLVAMAGIGLQTDLRSVIATGARPLVFGFGLAIALAVGSLAAITGLGLGAGTP